MASFEQKLDAQAGGYSLDPSTWGPYYAQGAKETGLPELLGRAIVQVENGGGRDLSTSEAGAEGIGQFMPSTAKEIGVDDVRNPIQAIPGIFRYLKKGLEFGEKTTGQSGRLDLALKHYYAGPDQSGWGPRTQAYPGQVLKAYMDLGGDVKDLGLTPELAQRYIAVAQGSAGMDFSVSARVRSFEERLDAANAPPPSEKPAGAVPTVEEATRALEAAGAKRAGQGPGVGVPGGTAPGTVLGTTAVSDAAAALLKPTVGQNPQWGPGTNLASSALLGYGPEVAAGVGAAGQAVSDIASGRGVGPSLIGMTQNFPGIRNSVQDAATAWQQQHPGQDLGTQLAGSIPMLMAATGLAGRAITAGGEALGGAMPALAPAIGGVGRFLGGTAGQAGSPTDTIPTQIGNWLLRRASQTAQGATVGAGQGAAAAHMQGQTPWEGAKIGAEAGGVLGLGVSPWAQMLQQPLNAPLTQSTARLAASPMAQRIGIPGTRFAQESGVKTLQKTLSPGDAHDMTDNWNKELNRILHGPAGSKELTAELVDRSRTAAGHTMDVAARQLAVVPDRQQVRELGDIARELRAVQLTDQHPLAPVRDYLDRTLQQMQAFGQLDGEEFAKAIRYNGPLGRLQRGSDSEVRYMANRIFDALDEAAERTAKASGNAQAYRNWQDARTWYKNTLVAEQAVRKPTAAGGRVDPTTFKSIVNSVYTKSGRYGAGEIGELADLGQLLPRTTVQGDVEKGLSWRDIGHVAKDLGFAGLGGAAATHAIGMPEPSMVPALMLGGLGYAGLQGLKRYLATPAYRNHLVALANGTAMPTTLPNALTPTVVELRTPNRRLAQ